MTGVPIAGDVAGTVRAAVGLLTRVPVTVPRTASTGAAAFPLIGAALGIAGAIPLLVLPARDAPIAAILAMIVIVGLDGALHLDGLADSADGLAASDPAASERARTDPRIGAGGAATLVLVILADVASLGLLAAAAPVFAAVSLVAAATGGRAAVAILAPWVPRRLDGFGAWFGSRTTPLAAAVAAIGLVAVAVAACLLAGSAVPGIAIVAGAVVAASVLVLLARAQSGATGDAHGAAIELGFAAALVAAAILRP
jgi:adenosylcobinamide-GDP ribazoletransferase